MDKKKRKWFGQPWAFVSSEQCQGQGRPVPIPSSLSLLFIILMYIYTKPTDTYTHNIYKYVCIPLNSTPRLLLCSWFALRPTTFFSSHESPLSRYIPPISICLLTIQYYPDNKIHKIITDTYLSIPLSHCQYIILMHH